MKNNKNIQSGAVIYCRVSTKEQVDEGNSLVTQERLCRDYANKNGYDVVGIFIEEGESAKTMNRKSLHKMINFCRDNKEAINSIIFYKIDRLSRDTADYLALKVVFNKLGIFLCSVSESLEDSPTGRFMETVIAGSAQFDNEIRSERCRNGMMEGVRGGRYVFIAPFGYINGTLNGEKNILVDETKSKYIKRIFELLSTQLYTPEDVRKIITKEGAKLGRGTTISKQYFHRLIRNKVYKGVIDINGFDLGEVKGSFSPIVSEELFDIVQDVLKKKGKRKAGYCKNNPDFPLRGLIMSQDGHKLDGSWSRGNGKEILPYYRFRGLSGFNTKRSVLENKFIEFLKDFELKSDFIVLLKNSIALNWDRRNLSNKQLREKTERNILLLKERREMLIDKNLKGVIDDDLAKEQLDKIKDEINNLLSEIKNYGDSENITEVLEYSLNFLKDLSVSIQDLKIQQRKSLQWFLFPEGIVFDGNKLRTTKTALILDTKKTSLSEKSSMVDPKGFEPLTPCLQSRCSSQLS